MATKYPAQIDNSTTLPTVVDTKTPLAGSPLNTLRNAIIAIETELGVKPSASYSTIRARLDTIEASINASIVLTNDLSGNLSHPTVVGIQNRPVSQVAPNLGDVLFWNGISWVPNDLGHTLGNITISPGSLLTTSGTGNINLPNNINSRFMIESVSVGPTVLANNLTTLTNGGNATALHTHTGDGSFVITTVQTSLYNANIGELVRCDPTAAGFVVNLPTAVGNVNKSIIVKNIANINGKAITVTANGVQTIDGASTFIINIAYQSITVTSDGSNWMIV